MQKQDDADCSEGDQGKVGQTSSRYYRSQDIAVYKLLADMVQQLL